jgi:DNA-binding winged helix-turn-helix (wHTH) protein/TolB-like protein/Tfp pilus assembly protein PilF
MQDSPRQQRVSLSAFQLNNLHVDPAIGVVTGHKGSVRLEPRVMAVLQALALRPGEMVSRADLLADIWPGGNVYEEALTQCVYQLRQQLISAGGDECRTLISTVPKRGYLLTGEVHTAETAPEATGDSPLQRPFRLIMFGVLSTLLIAASLMLILKWADSTNSGEATGAAQTLAVLPFLPLVEENRDPALELGMADTLIARLSGSGAIIVRPITSVRRYAGMERNSLEAGRELGADAVVEGSIQRSGEVMRVTVRLLRVADGAALWADTFNENFSGIFSVQDDICKRIAAALVPELVKPGRKIMAQPGTSNAAAYELYLKGRYHLSRLTPADMRESIRYFHEAVALDPGYAQAWLGLASVQFRFPIAGEAPPMEYFPQAKLAAQKALEIDPSLAEGYAMLGWIAHWYEWDWPMAETYFKQAIELDPNDTESHLGFAHLLSSTGRAKEALIEVRRARELSPFYMVAAMLEGQFLMGANRPEEALQRLEEARRLDENFWLVRTALARVYFSMGRIEDALAEANEARRLSRDGTWALANTVPILVRLGEQAEAGALVDGIRQRLATRYVPPYDLAVAYLGLGDADTALAWLASAYEARDPKMALMGTDPGWNFVQGRQEYVDLMRRMKLAESPE